LETTLCGGGGQATKGNSKEKAISTRTETKEKRKKGLCSTSPFRGRISGGYATQKKERGEGADHRGERGDRRTSIKRRKLFYKRGKKGFTGRREIVHKGDD